MPEACNIQHKIQQIMNMVKTNFYRIQVYKCFAVNDIGSKHENKTAKKNLKNLNDENNARFSANVVIHTVKMLMNISWK